MLKLPSQARRATALETRKKKEFEWYVERKFKQLNLLNYKRPDFLELFKFETCK